ncbi:MAG TPA: hypothetical protein VFZ09_10910 [Archangium sp.]|nr:hypothetical protein [Archangium sp.]HEX5746748.1 hypothetical protein [Archangium sp.]
MLARHAEEERFLQLLRQARPGWLLVAVVLQLATYHLVVAAAARLLPVAA